MTIENEHGFRCAMCLTMHYWDDCQDCFFDTEHTEQVRTEKLEIELLRCRHCGGIAAISVHDVDTGGALYTMSKDAP